MPDGTEAGHAPGDVAAYTPSFMAEPDKKIKSKREERFSIRVVSINKVFAFGALVTLYVPPVCTMVIIDGSRV
jgi:hypothetical protein